MGIPNVLGFIFGIIQMVLYLVYKNAEKAVDLEKKKAVELGKRAMALEEEEELPEIMVEQVIDVVKLGNMVCPAEMVPAVPLKVELGEHNLGNKEVVVTV
ncbi:hypothetical protein U1Q18_027167 [Sarracenia purpurea var. burkii]